MTFPKSLAPALRSGAIAVIPTDTIYGIVTSALNKESVERIYTLKKRSPEKPCIILLHRAEQMGEFGVQEEYVEKVLSYKREDPTSFIVPIARTDLEYLDRGTNTLAFRIPERSDLHDLLAESGPLIAPSANTEGSAPATTIAEARAYFEDTAEYYIDGGTIVGAPSILIDIATGTRLR
ncbi:MAG: L-threonylcarbamoyladenylate synthase [Patescibacteria group bacterium]